MDRIATIGGGTGSYTLLRALKNYDLDLGAIVSASDNGKSSGELRDEFGILPPGDARRCLIALSEGEGQALWRRIFEYTFGGEREKHNLGNLIITALTDIYQGDTQSALDEVSRMLGVRGRVIYATLDNVHLCAELEDGEIIKGETNIDMPKHNPEKKIKRVYLNPEAFAYKKAIETIDEANLIVIGPGDLYTSIIPNLLVNGIPETIRGSKARKVYVCNVMTKNGETNNFGAIDFVKEFKKYLGDYPDIVLCNNNQPSKEILEKYSSEKSSFVEPNIEDNRDFKVIKEDLIDEENAKKEGLIRHDSKKLGRLIRSLL